MNREVFGSHGTIFTDSAFKCCRASISTPRAVLRKKPTSSPWPLLSYIIKKVDFQKDVQEMKVCTEGLFTQNVYCRPFISSLNTTITWKLLFEWVFMAEGVKSWCSPRLQNDVNVRFYLPVFRDFPLKSYQMLMAGGLRLIEFHLIRKLAWFYD